MPHFPSFRPSATARWLNCSSPVLFTTNLFLCPTPKTHSVVQTGPVPTSPPQTRLQTPYVLSLHRMACSPTSHSTVIYLSKAPNSVTSPFFCSPLPSFCPHFRLYLESNQLPWRPPFFFFLLACLCPPSLHPSSCVLPQKNHTSKPISLFRFKTTNLKEHATLPSMSTLP